MMMYFMVDVIMRELQRKGLNFNTNPEQMLIGWRFAVVWFPGEMVKFRILKINIIMFEYVSTKLQIINYDHAS